MGNRVAELDRAVESALNQIDGDIEVVIVGNGADVPKLKAVPPPGSSIRTIRLEQNSGIPAGRNRGVEECSGDIVLFLDDDGWYASPKIAAHVRERIPTAPDLPATSPRVMGREGGTWPRRHAPRTPADD